MFDASPGSSLPPDRIYAKTAKGRAEVAQRSAMLGARERSILIILDGQKPCAALSELLPMPVLAPILDQLEKLELIRALAMPPDRRAATAEVALAAALPPLEPRPTLASSADAPLPAAAPANLAQARATMIATAERLLGLLAADVVRQINAAEGKDQLQRALAHWHMAMQASKHGRVVAAQHLERIKAILQMSA